MKKLLSLFLTVSLLTALLAGCGKSAPEGMNIGVLNGPTGLGAVKIMAMAEAGEYPEYQFTLSADPTDIAAKLVHGELDMGALPTNLAASLYQKTGGQIQVVALNCLGVLYILERGDRISSPADLKGRTILANGRGANPEYVLNYILRSSGLEPGRDVQVEFADPSEISARMVSGEADLCMLPVPAATAVLMKAPEVREALDLTEAYRAAASDGSELTMGCLAVRSEYLKKHPKEVEEFLKRYAQQVDAVLTDIPEAAELAAQAGLAGSAKIAEHALPAAGIVCITGKEIRPALEGYLKVLYDADPSSVGGKMPADDFYYEGR